MTLDQLKNKLNDIGWDRDCDAYDACSRAWWEGYAGALADEQIINKATFDEFIKWLKPIK